MKALSKYDAPMTLLSILIIFPVSLAVAFAWIQFAVPPLSTLISPLDDGHPVLHSVLQTSIRALFLPMFIVPLFVMVHFYQRRYDKKTRGQFRRG
jgi:hypothetical protein